MSGTIKRRLLNLERKAESERAAMTKQIQYDVFQEMHLTYEDRVLLDAIADRGEPATACTPEEQAALDRFSAEFEAAFKTVSSRKGHRNLELNC